MEKFFDLRKIVNPLKSGDSERPANNEPRSVNQPKAKISKRKPVGKEAAVRAWTRNVSCKREIMLTINDNDEIAKNLGVSWVPIQYVNLY